MTPGPFEIPFYQGATWSYSLEFVDEDTEVPYDLTGLGPFVMTVRDKDGTILSETNSVGPYDATGIISFEVDSSVTALYTLGTVYVGIVDNNMEPYAVGTPKVLRFSAPAP